MSERIEEPVPKLPRGRGLRFSGPEMFRIVLTLATLLGVIVLARPCANAVSGFVTSFDGSGSAQQLPKPGSVDVSVPQQPMETLRPGMTDEEIKAAIERSKARAAAARGAGGSDGSAASGDVGGSRGSAAGGDVGSSRGSAAAGRGGAAGASGSAAPADPVR